jgi:hypothetical protein
MVDAERIRVCSVVNTDLVDCQLVAILLCRLRDADRVHLCEPVPNPTGELGGILGNTAKWFVPVVEKSLADGTILSWSTFEQVVHTPDGYTHGAACRPTASRGPDSLSSARAACVLSELR